jgi:hypothetical protein
MVKPIAKFRAGQVSCALWENQATIDGRIVTVLKATIERRYRDAGGSWKSSNSFGRNEIPLAVHCLQKAFDHIVEKQADEEPALEEEVR